MSKTWYIWMEHFEWKLKSQIFIFSVLFFFPFSMRFVVDALISFGLRDSRLMYSYGVRYERKIRAIKNTTGHHR